MKTKTKIKYSENFLNNQNYILGKTEKKKLLSKFFVEKNIYLFLNFLNIFTNIFNYLFKYLYSLLFLFITIFLVKEYDFGIISGAFFLGIPISLIMIPFFTSNKKYKNGKIEKIEQFFINEKVYTSGDKEYVMQKSFNISILVFFIILSMYLIDSLTHLSNFEDLFIYIYVFIPFFIVFYLYFKYKKIILGFNYFNLLFIPVLVVFLLPLLIFSYIYIFIFKNTNGYYFLKKEIDSNLLLKFKSIINNIAENNYYIIKSK